jgi:hypothetical protein
LVDTPGEKKPRVKEPPAETSVSPSVRFWPFSSLSPISPAAEVWIERRKEQIKSSWSRRCTSS